MLLDLIFPPRCPVCDEILKDKKQKVHPECHKKLKYINEPRCKKCGKAMESYEKEYCFDCKKNKHVFDGGAGVFQHTKEIRESVYRFKYSNKREYAEFFAEEIEKKVGKLIKLWAPEIIMPIPLHKSKMITRGYNQAEVLGKILANRLDLPFESKVLSRLKKTVPQKELSVMERRKNLESAFKIEKDIVEYKRVLLIDDIYTTGSTIDACAKALKKTGVEEVFFVVVSVGEGI